MGQGSKVESWRWRAGQRELESWAELESWRAGAGELESQRAREDNIVLYFLKKYYEGAKSNMIILQYITPTGGNRRL